MSIPWRRNPQETSRCHRQQRRLKQIPESRSDRPLTTNLDRLYPSEAVVHINGKQNKAMADQLTTVSKTRLLNLIGILSPIDMRKVEQVIKVQLALAP